MMMLLKDWTCEDCGACLSPEQMAEHAFDTGHRTYTYTGNIDETPKGDE